MYIENFNGDVIVVEPTTQQIGSTDTVICENK